MYEQLFSKVFKLKWNKIFDWSIENCMRIKNWYVTWFGLLCHFKSQRKQENYEREEREKKVSVQVEFQIIPSIYDFAEKSILNCIIVRNSSYTDS